MAGCGGGAQQTTRVSLIIGKISGEKNKKTVQRLAPWYNLNNRKLKQKAHELERKWCSTKVEELRMAWQDSLKVYRKALRRARMDYWY